MDVTIAAIVEGHGECEAVPILIRRIAREIDSGLVPKVLHPIRVSALKLRKADEIERCVRLASAKLQGKGGILVLVDCDWESGCPATDGPAFLQRANAVRGNIPVAVVLAKREFEAWFLAAAESLRGQKGLPLDLEAPPDPEEIRGAKEWLSNRMPRGRTYSETTDQPAFAELFDMEKARSADSFDKCYREIRSMIRRISMGTGD